MSKFLKHFKGKKHDKNKTPATVNEKSSHRDAFGEDPAPTKSKKLELDTLLKQDEHTRSKTLQHTRWFHRGVNRKRAEIKLSKGIIRPYQPCLLLSHNSK